MPNYNYPWAKTQTDELIGQLFDIGVQLPGVGPSLGLTPAQITQWQQGAVVLVWMQGAIGTIRDFSTAFTNARDRILIDKGAKPFMLPTLTMPPQSQAVQDALADPNFATNFLKWCDGIVENTIMKSDNYNPTVEKQLGFVTPPPPIPRDQMQPTIRSSSSKPNGLVEFNVDRQFQPQIRVRVTLSDGQTFENRLPSAKIPVQLPLDRPFSYTATTRYTDKMGVEYGLESQPFSGTSVV